MANVALIFSGQYVKYVSNLRVGLPPGTDLWGNSLKLLMGAVVGCGGLIMAIMAWMQSNVLTDPECVPPVKRDAKKKKVRTLHITVNDWSHSNISRLTCSALVCLYLSSSSDEDVNGREHKVPRQ